MIKKAFSAVLLLNILALQSGFAFAQIIEDDVAIQSFKGQKFVKPVCVKQIQRDEAFLESNSGKQPKPVFKLILQEDTFIKEQPPAIISAKHVVHYKIIDENAEIVKISVCSARDINLKKEPLKVNQLLDFKVADDVCRGGEIFIKKDTTVNAVVELVSKSDKFGDPQELELGQLWTKDIKGNMIELEGTIRKEGANRGKWAKPLYYAGGYVPIFGAPFLLCYFVKGGKVKLSPKQKFDFYYE